MSRCEEVNRIGITFEEMLEKSKSSDPLYIHRLRSRSQLGKQDFGLIIAFNDRTAYVGV